MWYEILPSLTLVGMFAGIPHVAGYVMNKLALGNMYRRSLLTPEERLQYIRDTRLSGNPYVVQGLEVIPDE